MCMIQCILSRLFFDVWYFCRIYNGNTGPKRELDRLLNGGKFPASVVVVGRDIYTGLLEVNFGSGSTPQWTVQRFKTTDHVRAVTLMETVRVTAWLKLLFSHQMHWENLIELQSVIMTIWFRVVCFDISIPAFHSIGWPGWVLLKKIKHQFCKLIEHRNALKR